MIFWRFAEMDSPISNTEVHPYGRGRVGTKEGSVNISRFVYRTSDFMNIKSTNKIELA